MAKDDSKVPAKKSSNADVEAFLRKVALTPIGPKSGARGRLIFAMDATASREPTWDRACHIQGQMFVETAALGGLEAFLHDQTSLANFRARDRSTSKAGPDSKQKTTRQKRPGGPHN